MGICINNCNKETSAVPHSDLFVPSYDLNVSVRSQKKKLLKFGSMQMKDDIDNLLFNRLNKITTEKIIRAKSMRKLNQSGELHSSRPSINNELKLKFEIFENNESLHDSLLNKATDKLNTNTNTNNILTTMNNNYEKKKENQNSGFAKFKTMIKKEPTKKK